MYIKDIAVEFTE